ncbi:hypothetical protein BD769DRAFT_1393349 [Suillus cothurnatus]|nr:hypothetical protein BD769DRAFT_1393349 [Suillus cothurnatus]
MIMNFQSRFNVRHGQVKDLGRSCSERSPAALKPRGSVSLRWKKKIFTKCAAYLTTGPANLSRFHTFNPMMEDVCNSAQPLVSKKRSYIKKRKYIQVSRGFMEYIPSSGAGDQEHPSASPDIESQGHTPPMKSPMTFPDSAHAPLSSLTPASPASAPLSSLQPSSMLPSSDNFESTPEAQSQVIETQAVFELLQALASAVPEIGSPDFADESHLKESEDSEYDKLLEEIIQWPGV